MSWMDEIRALRREVPVLIANAITRAFVWTTTANASELGKEDAVRLADDDSDQRQRPARRIEPFGFRSRPPAKQRCLSLRLGSSTVIYLGIASDGGYGPGDLEDGETAIYSKNVEKALHARTAGDVALNGDAFSALKTEDFLSALKTFMDAARGSVTGTVPIVVTSTGVPTGAFKTAADALWTAINADAYKSNKVKHG